MVDLAEELVEERDMEGAGRVNPEGASSHE